MKKISLSLIKQTTRNPRKISKNKLEQLKRSISEFTEMMEMRPLVADENLNLIGGNQRYIALKELGYKEIPENWLIVKKGLTEEQKKEFVIRDNTHYGEWDFDILNEDWDSFKLNDWGIDFKWPDEVVAVQDEYDDDEDMQVDVTLGDVIQIGRHKLICGDSTSPEVANKLMNGQLADLAHNDPPYGMKKEKDGVINDNLNYNALLEFNKEWIELQVKHLKPNGSFYCWGIDEPLMDIYYGVIKPMIKDRTATFRNLITWDKGSGQSQNSELTRSYATADEKCLFIAMSVMGEMINGCDYQGEYDKIINYLQDQEAKSGLDKKEMKEILGKNMYSHYMTTSQFTLISEPKYKKLQEVTGLYKTDHSELKEWFKAAKIKIRNEQFYFNNTHDNMNNVWHFARHIRKGDEGGHATPKPIPLCERAIKSSCPDNGLVIDYFLGSGSTMVAAHQIDRTCYGIELDPRYCQVVINRMKNLDDSLVIKINGKKYTG